MQGCREGGRDARARAHTQTIQIGRSRYFHGAVLSLDLNRLARAHSRWAHDFQEHCVLVVLRLLVLVCFRLVCCGVFVFVPSLCHRWLLRLSIWSCCLLLWRLAEQCRGAAAQQPVQVELVV